MITLKNVKGKEGNRRKEEAESESWTGADDRTHFAWGPPGVSARYPVSLCA